LKESALRLLQQLCAIPGPVGHEDRVQEFMASSLKELADKITTDKIGNLTAVIEGTGPHYALVAHADEVGFFISGIDARGFLSVKWSTQGHEPDYRLLPGQRIKIMTDQGMVPGCFCVKTAHIAGAEGKKQVPSAEEVFIDIGASSGLEVNDRGIFVGAPVVYAETIDHVGSNVVGKSLDDRAGLTVLLLIAKMLAAHPKDKRPTVTMISTVMEELGAKGVTSAAGDLEADAVIVIDIGLADDYPGTHGEAGVALGKGPVIVIKDSQLVYSHMLNSRILEVADKNSIPVQRAVYHNYATDGFPLASLGQRVAAIGIPCRFSHSSFETIRLGDLEYTVQLIYEFLMEKISW
jgi:putative aminopeptidase FrvX